MIAGIAIGVTGVVLLICFVPALVPLVGYILEPRRRHEPCCVRRDLGFKVHCRRELK